MKSLELSKIWYVRHTESSVEPRSPALGVALVDLRLHLLAEVLSIVTAAALRIAQDALLALEVALRPDW